MTINSPQAPEDITDTAIKKEANMERKREQTGCERATLETLALAAIAEQRQSRRWRNGIRLAWLAFFVTLLWLGMDRGGTSTDTTTPHTALVKIQGEISSGS